MTSLDLVTIVLFFLMGIGLWWWALDWLNWRDWVQNRENQCPPHDWQPYYEDTEKWGHKFIGLRCGKCKRTPNGLTNGESWTGRFGSGPPTLP